VRYVLPAVLLALTPLIGMVSQPVPGHSFGLFAEAGSGAGVGQQGTGTVSPEKPPRPAFGDIDGDGDIDRDDLNILIKDINKSVGESKCGDVCDIHIDGMINTEDLHKLKEYCTRPDCATK